MPAYSAHGARFTFLRYNRVYRLSAAILCTTLYIFQTCLFDYLLIEHLGLYHMGWLVGDAFVLYTLLFSFQLSAETLRKLKFDESTVTHSIAWIPWLAMHVLSSTKIFVIFMNIHCIMNSDEHHLPSAYRPNVLKMTIALSSCIFLTLLTTQHDAPLATERRQFIEKLTTTIIFDLLDVVDILSLLFSSENRIILSSEIQLIILTMTIFNLLLPTLTLLVLDNSGFGFKGIPSHGSVLLCRMLMNIAVNLPNFTLRLVFWHGFAMGISPFMMKNAILICQGLYDYVIQKRQLKKHVSEGPLQTVKTKTHEVGDDESAV